MPPSPTPAPNPDAEATDALLVLGSELEWHHIPGPKFDAQGSSEEHRYEAYRGYGGGIFCLRVDIEGEGKDNYSPFRYGTEAAAKIACERHHRTGQWE